jgi:predicted metal-binding membrane protein
MIATSKLLPLGVLCLLAAAAWAYLLTAGMTLTMTSMSMLDGTTMAMPAEWTPYYVLRVFLMWSIMMVAMMLPSALPAAFVLSDTPSMFRFAAIYTAAWAGFAAFATLTQWLLSKQGLLSDGMLLNSHALAGGVLIAIGLYQLTPGFARDLTRCHDGKSYATSCLRCCAPLMLLLFVVGIMNVAWWVALMIFAWAEKASARGIWIARFGGSTLVLWGLFRILAGTER